MEPRSGALSVAEDGHAEQPMRLDQLFEAAVRLYGGRTAVSCGGQHMTYRQLDRAAARLAWRLQRRGIGPGALVAVCLHRSVHLLSALLAVVRTGAAYVPLDPEHPSRRRAQVLRDCAAALLITDEPPDDELLSATALISWPDDTPAPEYPAPGNLDPVVLTPASPVYTIYTSGSTGRPKGVIVTHGAFANFLVSMTARPGLPPGAVLVAVTTISFDIAALELFLPLTVGGQVVLATHEEALDPRLLAGLLAASGACAMQATPATWRMLREVGWEPPPDFTIMCGGERLPADLAGWFGHGRAHAWDLYGPTETTIWSSTALLDAGGVASWEPVANTSFLLLDGTLSPIQGNEEGEVFIAGAGLATGYLGRPALTAERFLPDPWGDGARLFRTGDIGRWREDGSLRILGRVDHQVKVRGHRVELGEIEAAATALPEVRMAVAHPQADPAGGTRLVLYLVPGQDRALDSGSVRTALAKTLPGYMLPSVLVPLRELPLTANGKVDRGRLPDPGPQSAAACAGIGVTGTERVLLEAWTEVLGIPCSGTGDDFFALGGHSLVAAALAARIRESLSVEVSVGELLRHPTVSAQARLIESASPFPSVPAAPPPPTGNLPLTSAQRRILFAELVRDGGPSYTTCAAYRVRGDLDLEALDRAVQDVAARHAALRTRFPSLHGEPVQRVDDHVRIPVTVIPPEPGTTCETLLPLLAREAQRDFDLEKGPPMRVLVLQATMADSLIQFCWHHIVFDGWSLGIFFDDLAAAYDRALSGHPPTPQPVASYPRAVVRYQQRLGAAATVGQLDYWRRRLAGAPDLCSLPADLPRPPVQSARGALVGDEIDRAASEEFRRLCRTQHITTYTGLLALFCALLARYTGSEDVVVGTPSAGRSHTDMERVVGLFSNVLALRTDIGGVGTFGVLAGRVRETVYQALEHQDVPFERVVEALRPERNLSRNPVFQVLFNLEAAETGSLRLGRTHTEPVRVDAGGSRYDLALTVRDGGGAMMLDAEYATDLYERATIQGLLRQYSDLIADTAAVGAAADLDRVLTASGTERAVLGRWNATGPPLAAGEVVHGLVDRQVRAVPDRVAVRDESGVLTYGELDKRAAVTAMALVASGVRPGDVVGVCVESGLGLPVTLLAVLRSGAAYLPLDPSYPAGRLAAILRQVRPPLVIVTRAGADRLNGTGQAVLVVGGDGAPPGEMIPSPLPLPQARPDDIAYVIHTSGSTGTPKGVAMPHRVLVNLTQWQLSAQLGGVRTAELSSIGFDVHFQEIFIPLASGGEVLFAPASARRDPALLHDWLTDAGVEQVICTPTLFEALAATARQRGVVPPRLREITTAGEQLRLTPDILWLLRRGRIALHNQYGPSETHAATATRVEVPAETELILPPPIGRPIANKRVHVLDRHGREVPVGVPGELYIGGDGIADGYLGMAGQTAARFLPDPFSAVPGGRMYRTGDVGRWLHGGVLCHCGRADDQIKIRGVRIEPGEIEVCLQRHLSVRAAAVAVREPAPGHKILTAYVVPAPALPDAGPPDAEELRRHLAGYLPAFAIPTRYVTLDELPLTPSGKVHRAALPMPADADFLRPQFVPPGTAVERCIARVWSEALGVTEVGAHDDFFVLGGHSLLAARVVTGINAALDATLHVRDLFAAPTVAGLAEALRRKDAGSPRPAAVPAAIDRESDGAQAPLSFAQHRMWFLDRLRPGSTEYLLPMVLRLRGALDETALQAALDALVARHEILRTRYLTEQGEPVLSIDPAAAVRIDRDDLSGCADGTRDDRVREHFDEELVTPFELARQHPLRARLLRLSVREHLLILTLHHIACDGHSLGLLRRELLELYGGKMLSQDSDRPQYADYARWQQQHMDESFLEPLVRHWKQNLEGYQLLNLPTDKCRPQVWEPEGRLLRFDMPDRLWDGVQNLARRSRCTPFMVLLAGFTAVLAGLTGQEDILIGTPTAGRWHPQTQDVVGSFADTLVIRIDANGTARFGELLFRVRESVLTAFGHQELPFDRLVREIRPPRNLSRSPLVDVIFNFVEETEPIPWLPGLSVTMVPLASSTAGLDLDLMVHRDHEGRVTGEILFAASLFAEDSAKRLVDDFLVTLDRVTSEPAPRLATQ